MTLQDDLARFRKQQQNCQSTLSRIASSKQTSTPPNTNSGTGNVPKSSTPAPASRPPAVKFSDDTKRLQMINTVRKAPAGAQIKRVIDLLFERRKALTPDQINEACYVDVLANKTVFQSLKNNPKVSYDGEAFSYKPKHEVKDKDELLDLIRKHQEGMPIVDLKDAYPNVMEDLQILKAERKVWLPLNLDSKEDIVYPNDLWASINVDDDLKTLFLGIKLPDDFLEVEEELRQSGIKPLTDTSERRKAAKIPIIPSKSKPKKKSGISKRTKLTNSHLPELFQN